LRNALQLTPPEDQVDPNGNDAQNLNRGFQRRNLNSKAPVPINLAQQPLEVPNRDDPSPLYNDEESLPYAIGEIMHFLINEQKDTNGNQKPFGLFSGKIIQDKWIERSIQIALEKNNITYQPDLTFQEIAAFMKDGKPLFRPFYVVAYNTALLRTEVFSYEHTPNVIVSDAVRASMSIPVFFTPEIIREKIDGKIGNRLISVNNKPVDAYYLDGGLTDNYPIWIFDDLKYCVEEDQLPDWKPQQKIFFRNPYTLGFKLTSKEKLDIYLNPYVDGMIYKATSTTEYNMQKSMQYFVESIASGSYIAQEDANYLHRWDWTRTVYVDNCGVSAVNFNISDDERKLLKQSGRDAVRKFKERAKNGFSGEGDYYPGRVKK